MAQSIYIRVTQYGNAVGPFNIYWDNFLNIVELNITLDDLLDGHIVSVPDAAQYIVLENQDPCGLNTQFKYIVPLSPTPSPSITPSYSVTPSVSISATPSVSVTPSASVTPSVSVTPSITVTPSFSITPSVSISATPSVSISATPSISVTPSASISATPSISVTPSVSVTASPSVTPSISVTKSVSVTPGVSVTPSITVTPSQSVTPSVTVSPSVTPSLSVTPSITVTPSKTVSPSVTPSTSVTPSLSVTPSVTTSISRTPSVSVTPSASVTPSISVTPSVSLTRTPSVSISRTPSVSLTPIVAYIYYRNTEANDGTVFLDNNVYIRNNTTSTDLVNDVFSTPGDVLVGGTQYQDQSIYAQSQGYIGGYPQPTYGTSTRTLTITDSAGNTIYNTTTPYSTDNINTNFTLVGGRTYYVRGRTDFSYPTSATLNIGGLYNGGSYYSFSYNLSDAVDGNFTINNYGIFADVFYSHCGSSVPEDGTYNSSAVTITKGQYGYGNISTALETSYGFNYAQLNNFIYIDGNYYSNGSTFVVGATTVTVSLSTSCMPL